MSHQKTCNKHGALAPHDIYVRPHREGKRPHLECRMCMRETKRRSSAKLKKEDPVKVRAQAKKAREIIRPEGTTDLLCRACKEEKKLEDFFPSMFKIRYPTCRRCCSQEQQVSKLKNQGTYHAWMKKNREYHRYRHLEKKYGLTSVEYEARKTAQKNLCAICNNPETALCRGGRISELHVDHDHNSGEIRGLLCNKCNRGLGYFVDDPTILRAAADYLERSKL